MLCSTMQLQATPSNCAMPACRAWINCSSARRKARVKYSKTSTACSNSHARQASPMAAVVAAGNSKATAAAKANQAGNNRLPPLAPDPAHHWMVAANRARSARRRPRCLRPVDSNNATPVNQAVHNRKANHPKDSNRPVARNPKMDAPTRRRAERTSKAVIPLVPRVAQQPKRNKPIVGATSPCMRAMCSARKVGVSCRLAIAMRLMGTTAS